MENLRIDRRTISTVMMAACKRKSLCDQRVSFRSLYTSAKPSLFFLAYKITGSRQVAEEIVQDVFSHAWHNTETYDYTRSSLVTWLMVMCRSRAIDYFRGQKIRNANEIHEKDWESIKSSDSNPELIYAESVCCGAVKLGLKSLSTLQRQLLVLNYYAHLSHSEIAGILNLPIGTVKTTIRRAKICLASQAELLDV